ncbi:hypothetical protein [Oceanithermus profundus]
MRKAAALLALGLGFLLAACSGGGASGNGGNGGGGDVTVTVTATGASAAAYRAGGGSWQAPSDPTSFTFTVTAGGAYDVVVRCGDNVSVLSLTTDDLNALDASCSAAPPATISFDVSYDASGVTGAAVVEIVHKASGFGGQVSNNLTGTFSVSDGVEGQQDLVILVYDSNFPPNLLAAKMYTVTATDGAAFDFTGDAITDSDAPTMANLPDFSAQVPAGWAGLWRVTAVTPNGTLVSPYGAIPTSSGGPYPELGFADRNVFMVAAENPPYGIGSFFVRASGAPTIALPAPIDPSVSGSPVSVANLTVGANLLAYTINVEWGTAVVVNVVISKAYLGSATGYSLPDLTALSGFADTLPAIGDTVNVTVTAVESNRTIAELANLGDTGMFFLPDGSDLMISEKTVSYGL